MIVIPASTMVNFFPSINACSIIIARETYVLSIAISEIKPAAVPIEPTGLHTSIDKIIPVPLTIAIDFLPTRGRNIIVVVVSVTAILIPTGICVCFCPQTIFTLIQCGHGGTKHDSGHDACQEKK